MEDYNKDTKHFVINQLKWIGIYMGIGLVIAALLPFILLLHWEFS